jgi:hypothetical protein
MDKQYYLNPNIKRTNLEESYTPEQVQEYIRCSQDPVYFIQKYVKINALDEGLVPFSLRGYQENLIKGYHENRKCIVKSSRQSGKCQNINTPIRLRNKKTGQIIQMTIGEFYEHNKNNM